MRKPYQKNPILQINRLYNLQGQDVGFYWLICFSESPIRLSVCTAQKMKFSIKDFFIYERNL